MSKCARCGYDPPQLDLTDLAVGPKHRTTDGPTARKAALDNEPRRGTQRQRILEAILAAGSNGATAAELAVVTSMPYVSVSTRVSELVRGGWVLSTPHTRPTENGGDAQVVIAASKALHLYEAEAA